MTQAVSAKGVILGVKISGTYEYFHEVKSVPEMGESADKIDVTSLESETKEYIKDIPDYSADLEFTMNAMPTGVSDSNYDLIDKLDKDETYEWIVKYPQLGVQVTLNGEWTWRMGGGEVSSAQDIIVTVIPKSGMTWAKISEGLSLSFDANGGEGGIATATYSVGTEAAVPGAEALTAPEGQTFLHWNTKPDNTGATYGEGDSISMTGATTLYAIWGQSE